MEERGLKDQRDIKDYEASLAPRDQKEKKKTASLAYVSFITDPKIDLDTIKICMHLLFVLIIGTQKILVLYTAGLNGTDGLDGRKGPSGPPGERGDKGPKGRIGFSGYPGKTGPKGFPSRNGSHGIPGIDGIDGNIGKKV